MQIEIQRCSSGEFWLAILVENNCRATIPMPHFEGKKSGTHVYRMLKAINPDVNIIEKGGVNGKV